MATRKTRRDLREEMKRKMCIRDSSTTSLINLLVALFVGLSVGSNVVVARNLGGKRHDMVGRAVHTSILMALVSGAILAVFGFFAARQLLVRCV